MNKFYTSRGDQGETDHLGTGRLSKSHIRIQTVGALDEASAALGFARAQISDPAIDQLIKTVHKPNHPRALSFPVKTCQQGRLAWPALLSGEQRETL